MTDFMIRFLFSNIFISAMIGILFAAKWIFKKSLTSRMQYNLWLLLLGLLIVPFLPTKPINFLQIFSWMEQFKSMSVAKIETVMQNTAAPTSFNTGNWMNDFALSINMRTTFILGLILCGIWIIGILAMLILMLKSKLHINTLQKSALPLQNKEVRRLYNRCLDELNITKNIPVYSTAFLKSPVIVGFLRPCIYLPLHLISDYNAADMRYMLLHELQHYKHKDALVNILMNLAGIFYWFNPFVWYALKEMRNDREVACDTSVLKMLNEEDYENYGNTLINFAEKVSFTPFPFTTGISGTMKQMKKRIINIASYEKPSVFKKIKGITAFVSIALLLLSLAPTCSTYAMDESHYYWNISSETVSFVDLSTYFGEYEGSFVMYDLEKDCWSIYDMKHATLRTAPDSTYKIYDALFGLEEDIITPENSLILWNKQIYPFDTWNTNQTLQSAMCSSVNWYFQTIDQQLGITSIYNYIQKIGYGNENISGDVSTYWLESSLKISPIEQVELLTKLYNNDWGFSPENINAVKNSICLSSSETGDLYGKTGTGRVNGLNVNGWFIGYIEDSGHTYFFAVNINADSNAAGSNAAEIALSILSDMNIWK